MPLVPGEPAVEVPGAKVSVVPEYSDSEVPGISEADMPGPAVVPGSVVEPGPSGPVEYFEVPPAPVPDDSGEPEVPGTSRELVVPGYPEVEVPGNCDLLVAGTSEVDVPGYSEVETPGLPVSGVPTGVDVPGNSDGPVIPDLLEYPLVTVSALGVEAVVPGRSDDPV